MVRVAEPGFLLSAYYRSRTVASGALLRSVVLDQLAEVYPVAEDERDIQTISGEAVCRQLEATYRVVCQLLKQSAASRAAAVSDLVGDHQLGSSLDGNKRPAIALLGTVAPR